MSKLSRRGLVVGLASVGAAAGGAPAVERLRLIRAGDEIRIEGANRRPVATLVLKNERILRPYLKGLHSPAGIPLTRSLPPVAGVDAVDHDTMHPGVWLAFGDLGGADFWRNKGLVRCNSAEATAAGDGVRILLRSEYLAPDERRVCTEECRITLLPAPLGTLLLLDSLFRPADGPLAFGDQEEMGLGVRVATSLSVAKGGEIVSDSGARNERQVWGKQANWCAYQGIVGDRRAGLLVAPHPGNFRRSWMHARDYGLLVANPFGRKAFTGGEPDSTPVPPGQGLRLRFGVLAFDEAATAPGDLAGRAAAVLRGFGTE